MTLMTCAEASRILHDAGLGAPVSPPENIPQRLLEAETHYAKCPRCRPAGLAVIFKPLTCREAIAACVRGTALLYSIDDCLTLGEVLAHEHVYGVHTIREDDGVPISPKFGEGISQACSEPVCSRVRAIWFNAPLSSHYDGDDELAHGIEQALDIAKKAGWDMNPLITAAPVPRLGKHQQLNLPL
jgi:hypothetical protein